MCLFLRRDQVWETIPALVCKVLREGGRRREKGREGVTQMGADER